MQRRRLPQGQFEGVRRQGGQAVQRHSRRTIFSLHHDSRLQRWVTGGVNFQRNEAIRQLTESFSLSSPNRKVLPAVQTGDRPLPLRLALSHIHDLPVIPRQQGGEHGLDQKKDFPRAKN